MEQRKITRAALLLALTIAFQSLRLIFLLPPFTTTIIIGTLVNACLLLAVETVGFFPALLIAVVAPLIAFMQNMLPVPILILSVAMGNAIYLAIFNLLYRKYPWKALAAAAICKTGLLFASSFYLLKLFTVSPKIAGILIVVMGWPQLFTGLLGGVLAIVVAKRLNRI